MHSLKSLNCTYKIVYFFLIYTLYLKQPVKNSLLKREKDSKRKKLRFGVLIIALYENDLCTYSLAFIDHLLYSRFPRKIKIKKSLSSSHNNKDRTE